MSSPHRYRVRGYGNADRGFESFRRAAFHLADNRTAKPLHHCGFFTRSTNDIIGEHKEKIQATKVRRRSWDKSVTIGPIRERCRSNFTPTIPLDLRIEREVRVAAARTAAPVLSY